MPTKLYAKLQGVLGVKLAAFTYKMLKRHLRMYFGNDAWFYMYSNQWKDSIGITKLTGNSDDGIAVKKFL